MTAATRAFALLTFALAALAAAGCPSENRRVVTQPAYQAPPQLIGDETQPEVERKWGKPDRAIDVLDEKTGRITTVWVYERYVDTNGSKLDTMLTFEGGRLTKQEKKPIPRTPVNVGMPRDSAAKRDME